MIDRLTKFAQKLEGEMFEVMPVEQTSSQKMEEEKKPCEK